MSSDKDAARGRAVQRTGGRLAESLARIALGLALPGVGVILGESVTFARALYDDTKSDSARAALERRVGALEHAAGARTLKGDAARLLALSVLRANESDREWVEVDEAMRTLELTADAHRAAAEEIRALGLAIVDGNLNSPSGYQRVRPHPRVFVQVIGQLALDVDVRRELGQVLSTVGRGGRNVRVGRKPLLALGIPGPRLYQLLQFLHERELVIERGPGDADAMWYDVEMQPLGWRALNEDDPLPVA